MSDCTRCGKPVAYDATVCPACGADLREPTASFDPVTGAELPPGIEGAEGLEGPVLVVRKGPQPGERFYLDRASLTVGRDPESDIFLNDMTVSRMHAVLALNGDEVSVRDAGSLNGTYVNGICVDAAILQDGDVLQIGTFQMLFVNRGGSAR